MEWWGLKVGEETSGQSDRTMTPQKKSDRTMMERWVFWDLNSGPGPGPEMGAASRSPAASGAGKARVGAHPEPRCAQWTQLSRLFPQLSPLHHQWPFLYIALIAI
jgi:hypothetical protein